MNALQQQIADTLIVAIPETQIDYKEVRKLSAQDICKEIITTAETIEGPEREHTGWCLCIEYPEEPEWCTCGATEYNQRRAERLEKWKEITK